ncbi:carbohydrate esterase family 1 protein [Tortispora caseinolytica NRRL Y-17796]|uniref:S-formylglutathione hydrolase n=1 Tax=Tortispora caseinolytica NRRL Y-17796 TaxID=767744 RepID=A0A1E4TCL7_9ASCO|nr:carbohydrate esterase family 1 protein [Tortispora caseinolytica NRRL Y-17796]
MAGKFEITSEIASFGGKILKLTHESAVLRCKMAVNLYLPPNQGKVPVLFYLSGLTCTGDNCLEKGFLQAHASKLGIAIVYPDTSPRGLGIPGEDESWDFGTGAGFYIDALKEPFKGSYNMYSYINDELQQQLFSEFDQLDSSRISLSGHSMGGHGALTIFLKNPGKYKSVSAFAPISNPINCPWGQKAFAGYLGDDQQEWAKHDATELMKKYSGPKPAILIDVGTGDNFYKQKQLLPEHLEDAAKSVGWDVQVRYQPNYDHSYFFVSTFGADHIAHAAKFLGTNSTL